MLALLLAVGVPVVGQQAAESPEDAAVTQICQLAQINEGDQSRIAEWVQLQVDRLGQIPGPAREEDGGTEKDPRLEAANKFRDRLAGRLSDKRCTDAFRTQFAIQAAGVAEKALVNASTGAHVAYGLARVLVEMNRPETIPALMTCLKSSLPVARFVCARGLTEQRQAIAADKEKTEAVVRALREAGVAERNPIALAHIYRALGLTNQAVNVFSAYAEIFARRLQDARAARNLVGDGAEIEAFAFLDSQGVLDALNQNQKQQLVGTLAEFLGFYAARYNVEKLGFEEIDRLERSLFYVESLLDRLVDKDGGKMREILTSQGHAGRASVAAEAAKWIGDPESKAPGTLNAAPWNVPLGGSAQVAVSAHTSGSKE